MNGFGNRDIRVGLVVILAAAFSIFVLIPAGVTVPENVEVRVMAPDFWPLFVSIGAGIAGAFVVVGGMFDLKSQWRSDVAAPSGESLSAEPRDDTYRPFGEGAVRVAFAIGALFALYAAVPHIGIVAGCMLLLVFLIRFTGEDRWRLILPIAVILPLVLYAFFVYVAGVPLPLGIFEQLR